ncbi:MAG: MATE family efflux transporter [Succiniclasticum sp.]
MQKSMTSGNSLKLLLTFMIPLIIGNIFQQMYSISDIIIVGRTIGVNALASVGAAAPIFMLLVMITMGLSNGLTVLTGQFFGANDLDKMRRSVAVSMRICVMAVIVLAVGMHIIIDPLLHLMNLPEILYRDSRSYILIVAEGLWAMMAYNFFSAVLRALGDSKTPVYFLVFATVINVGLALLFILKFGLGVPGSAYALVMAQGLSALLCGVYMWKNFPILRLRKSDWKWDTRFAISHLKMGLPMAGQFSILGVGILLIQSITNSFGPHTIAGFTAAIRVEQLALQPMASFGIAMAAFSAQNYGARQFQRIRDAVKKCSLIAMAFAFCAGILIFFFSENIIGVFIEEGNPDVVKDALLYLNCSVPFYFFLSQMFIYRSAVQGMGVGMVPLASSLIELSMRTGVAKFLAADWGYRGVCYASPVAWVAGSIFLFFAYHYFIRMFERLNGQA